MLLALPLGAPATAGRAEAARSVPPATAAIHGYVRLTSGAPLFAEVQVFGYDTDGSYHRVANTYSPAGPSEQYRIEGLIPDTTYHVCVQTGIDVVAECFNNVAYNLPPASRTEVSLAAGESRRMDFYLVPRATISGTVTGPPDAVSSVNVCAKRTPETSSLPNHTFCQWVYPGDTYTIYGVDPGKWLVCFQFGGLKSECWEDALYGDFDPTPSDPDPPTVIDVPDSTPITGIDASLERAASVRVTVNGITAPAAVDLYRAKAGSWQLANYTSTKKYGTGPQRFFLDGLPPGTYRICARPWENEDDPGPYPTPPVTFAPYCLGGPTVATAEDFLVGDGEQVSGLAFSVDLPASIGGTVSGVNRNVLVTLLLPDGRTLATTRTSTTGAYTFNKLGSGFFDLLPGGDYRIAYDRKFARSPYAVEYYRNVTEDRGLAASDVITVPAGGHFDAFNSLAIGGAIWGRLLDHNGDPPVGSCQVRVDAPGLTSRYALTEPDGRFKVRGLTTGAYVVQIRLDKCSVATAYVALRQQRRAGTSGHPLSVCRPGHGDPRRDHDAAVRSHRPLTEAQASRASTSTS